MSKVLKFVSVVFLWIAGLTLSTHLLIPHDHHLADTFLNQDENCPASNHNSDHRSGFPVHCHAFNDLTSEKTRSLLITENLQFSIDSFNILTDASSLFLKSSFISFKESSKPVFDTSILKSSSLRAPPALA